MNKLISFFILFSFMFLSCDSKKDNSIEINKLFENYYQETLKLYPLNATSQGDDRYNNFLPNDLTNDFRDDEKTLYTNYKNYLSDFDNNLLNTEDLLSKKVLMWECDRNLERLNFN